MSTSSIPRRHSYVLSLDLLSVQQSLTAGTGIPAPETPRSSSPFARPPTPGGGPLSSHPSTPDYFVNSNYTTAHSNSSDKENIGVTKMNSKESSAPQRPDSSRAQPSPSALMPPPQTKANGESLPQQRRSSSGVRKLLSLRDLRASFSSSRTSLASTVPRESHDTASTDNGSNGVHNNINRLKRPSSPSLSFSTTASTTQGGRSSAPMMKKKSGSWFRRKSGMFMMNADENGMALDAVAEDNRPDTRDSKRQRHFSPPPVIPEIGSLGDGATINGGNMGWDEQLFKA